MKKIKMSFSEFESMSESEMRGIMAGSGFYTLDPVTVYSSYCKISDYVTSTYGGVGNMPGIPFFYQGTGSATYSYQAMEGIGLAADINSQVFSFITHASQDGSIEAAGKALGYIGLGVSTGILLDKIANGQEFTDDDWTTLSINIALILSMGSGLGEFIVGGYSIYHSISNIVEQQSK